MSKAAKAAVRGQKWQQYEATGRGLTFTDRLCPVSPVASRHVTGFSSCFDTIMEGPSRISTLALGQILISTRGWEILVYALL